MSISIPNEMTIPPLSVENATCFHMGHGIHVKRLGAKWYITFGEITPAIALGRNFEWEVVPLPGNRDEAFYEKYGFDSANDAWVFLQSAVEKVRMSE